MMSSQERQDLKGDNMFERPNVVEWKVKALSIACVVAQ